jgi:hypothetical protein
MEASGMSGQGRVFLGALVAAVIALAGCDARFAPVGPPGATDAGFLGCQIGPQPGASVREGDPLAAGEPMAGVPVQEMTPRAVGELARSRGLKVTWRYSYGIDGPQAPVLGDPPVVAPVGPDGSREPAPPPGDGANEPPPGVALSYAECWCEPPPGGRVVNVAYGMASELVVFVDSGRTLAAPREQPIRGWGC